MWWSCSNYRIYDHKGWFENLEKEIHLELLPRWMCLTVASYDHFATVACLSDAGRGTRVINSPNTWMIVRWTSVIVRLCLWGALGCIIFTLCFSDPRTPVYSPNITCDVWHWWRGCIISRLKCVQITAFPSEIKKLFSSVLMLAQLLSQYDIHASFYLQAIHSLQIHKYISYQELFCLCIGCIYIRYFTHGRFFCFLCFHFFVLISLYSKQQA